MRRLALALGLLLACGGAAWAQDDEVETDRPDVSNSTRTVAPGAVQIETGVAYAYTRIGGAAADRRLSAEAAARVGLTERIEIRVDAEPFVRLRGEDDDTGTGDYTFAVKYRFWDPPKDSLLPSLGLQPFVKPPIAEEPIGSGRTDVGLTGLASFDLPADFSLDVNVGVAALGQRRGYLAQAQVSASLSRALTRRLSAFGEIFYASRAERDGRDSVGADTGVVFRAARDVQLDAAVATSLAGPLPDYVLRAGVTVRFGR